jgi:hypothetical protein
MDVEISGNQYALLICHYVARRYGNRGIKLYREVPVGKSIIGKDRRIDILVVHEPTNRALAIECKYQNSTGTTDEKIPYAIDDLRAMRMPACLVYAGKGFSTGVLHMLRASDMAAYCLPSKGGDATDDTRELDHILAMTFNWWDIVADESRRFTPQLQLPFPTDVATSAAPEKRRGPKQASTRVAPDDGMKKTGNG